MKRWSARSNAAHTQVLALLTAYENGNLALEEQQAVERHVAFCSVCRDKLADLQWQKRIGLTALPYSDMSLKIERLLADLEGTDSNTATKPGPRFARQVERVVAKVRSAPKYADSERVRWGWLGVLLALSLLLAVGFRSQALQAVRLFASQSFGLANSPRDCQLPELRVMFQAPTRMVDVEPLAKELQAEIVPCATECSVFVLRLMGTTSGEIGMAQAIAQVHSWPGVVSVVPAMKVIETP